MEALIYGSSDDLVELEIDGNPFDEFNNYSDEDRFLHFSDGTVVSACYSPEGYGGKWRINTKRAGSQVVASGFTPAANDDDDYSDQVKISFASPVKVLGLFGSENGPTEEDIDDWIRNFDFDELTASQKRKMFELVKLDK